MSCVSCRLCLYLLMSAHLPWRCRCKKRKVVVQSRVAGIACSRGLGRTETLHLADQPCHLTSPVSLLSVTESVLSLARLYSLSPFLLTYTKIHHTRSAKLHTFSDLFSTPYIFFFSIVSRSNFHSFPLLVVAVPGITMVRGVFTKGPPCLKLGWFWRCCETSSACRTLGGVGLERTGSEGQRAGYLLAASLLSFGCLILLLVSATAAAPDRSTVRDTYWARTRLEV